MFQVGRLADIKEFKDISLMNILIGMYIFSVSLYLMKGLSPAVFNELNIVVNKYVDLISYNIIIILKSFIHITSYLIILLFLGSALLLIWDAVYWKKYDRSESLSYIRFIISRKLPDYYYNLSMWYILYLSVSHLFDLYTYLPDYLSFFLLLSLMFLMMKMINFIFSNYD
ncbi:hypothetical protein CVD25_09630 [Bacillus canaveralius]|uniref:Uncharacterized protein n=1 Tax=Bacillus canaveralius TaxID=1403243 RepID=A0A2N5GGM0_9BACI|nr:MULTISPECIES: hypothetical protein [Bacillus]PLR79850.1 hypothetical protein CU635_20940 [Bacillus canaveralius]PLR87180.1 hypothetical protein CVD23_04185 [Bacillus sp. V33-4]PLR97801.1 hypothetical protein CVD25_09630 [Bacillus canaveralius]RSK45560.1 hypothetical protein EJA13_19220 [Bacillus canaveralius]